MIITLIKNGMEYTLISLNMVPCTRVWFLKRHWIENLRKRSWLLICAKSGPKGRYSCWIGLICWWVGVGDMGLCSRGYCSLCRMSKKTKSWVEIIGNPLLGVVGSWKLVPWELFKSMVVGCRLIESDETVGEGPLLLLCVDCWHWFCCGRWLW